MDFDRFFSLSLDLLCIADMDGRFHKLNPAWETTLGYSREELLARYFLDFVHPEDMAATLDAVSDLAAQKTVTGFTNRYRCKDGSYRWLEWRSAPAGHLIYAAARDVTNRVQTEEALRQATQSLQQTHKELERRVQERTTALAQTNEQLRAQIAERKRAEALYRTLFEQSPDAVFILDLAGNHQQANHSAAEMLGYTLEQMQQLSMQDVSANMAKSERVLTRLLAGERIRPYERLFRKKSGELVPVEIHVSLIRDEDGRPLHIQSIARDITERKLAEQEILKLNAKLEQRVAERTAELEVANQDLRQAKEEAEQANRAKSIFLSNMSHEIRTPINAIFGFTQLLQRDPMLTPRQREEVETIGQASEHLLMLINDVLEMAQIEAGRMNLNPAPFSLQSLLDRLELMFRSRTDAKGLQLLVERDESVPPYVTADEGKIQQIFINLLDNAVKFTEEGGIGVRIRGEPVAGTEIDGPMVRLIIEVEDTGRGISIEDQDRLFQPFHQAEGGAQAGGTGLGLTISRKFAQMMNGDISVTSQVDQGSRFRCQLLVQLAEDTAITEPVRVRRVTGLQPGTGPVRVLVVDDNAPNRTLVRKLLLPLGFEIEEAQDGQEALTAFARWSPHIILMDMRMPNMDGYEATRRVKATEAGRATPIIALTASAFAEAEQAVMNAGVDAYIRKPFREAELFTALANSLGLQYLYDEADDTAPATGPLEPAAIAALPGELLSGLRTATITGDRNRLLALLDEVAKQDATLAAALHNLASKYAYEKLLTLLDEI